MKNLITAAASLMILLAFLVQFTHSQMLHSRLMEADRQVNNFREAVRQEGCVSEERERSLKEALAEIFHCSQEEVTVTCTERRPVFRGQLVEYQVQAPVKEVVAVAGFWNISDEKNQFTYQASGSASSEYTGRER